MVYNLGSDVLHVADLDISLADLLCNLTGPRYICNKAHVVGNVSISFGEDNSDSIFEFFNYSYYLKHENFSINGKNLLNIFKKYLLENKKYEGEFKCKFTNLKTSLTMYPFGPAIGTTTTNPKPAPTQKKPKTPSPPDSPDAPVHGLFDDDDF